jgi:hypothetical protein
MAHISESIAWLFISQGSRMMLRFAMAACHHITGQHWAAQAQFEHW